MSSCRERTERAESSSSYKRCLGRDNLNLLGGGGVTTKTLISRSCQHPGRLFDGHSSLTAWLGAGDVQNGLLGGLGRLSKGGCVLSDDGGQLERRTEGELAHFASRFALNMIREDARFMRTRNDGKIIVRYRLEDHGPSLVAHRK